MNAYEKAVEVVEDFVDTWNGPEWDRPDAAVLSAEESISLIKRVAEALFDAYAVGLVDGRQEVEPVVYEVVAPTRSTMNAFARQMVNAYVNDDEEDEDDDDDNIGGTSAGDDYDPPF